MTFDDAAREYLGLEAESWQAWVALICVALCQANREQRRRVESLIRRNAPEQAVRELWLAIGRRGGKDYVTVRLAIYLAMFKTWKLAPGEVGVVLLLALDRAQAKVAYRYLRGALQANPALWAEVGGVTADSITFKNGIEVQIGTSDYGAVRGRTLLAVLCDEFAFWPIEMAIEILRAIRPGMATQREAMLIIISSVYSQRGPFFENFRLYFGIDDPRVLFARATTVEMNPTIDAAFIQSEIDRDPQAAAAEYLSEFRGDLEGFLDIALVDRATRTEPREQPYRKTNAHGVPMHYVAAVDVSGGRNDAAAAAVAHLEGELVVVDACRRWPSPHDPAQVAGEVAEFLAAYQLSSATADQYGAELSRSIYSEAAVALQPADVNRSEAYLAVLPLFTSGRIEIPDDPRLRTELLGLERRTGRSGKDSVDHVPNQHDDLANAVALAACRAFRPLTTGDNVTTSIRSTVLDGLDHNIDPQRYASIFDKYEAMARNPWLELDL